MKVSRIARKKLNIWELVHSIGPQEKEITEVAKTRIIPLLLGSYDRKTLWEMESVKRILVERGYANTLLVKDVVTNYDFKGKYDAKFQKIIEMFPSECLVVPIFFFGPKSRKCGVGHCMELSQLVDMKNAALLMATGIFKYESSIDIPSHSRFITREFTVKNLADLKQKVTNHVENLLPLVEKIYSREEKLIYTPKTSKQLKRGDFNEKSGQD